jgi:hypothetical protein
VGPGSAADGERVSSERVVQIGDSISFGRFESRWHTSAEVIHGPIGQKVSNVLEKLICGGGRVPISSGSICHFLKCR